MKQATGNKGIDWVEDQKLSDLDFADDIAALSYNTQDLQEFVNAIGETEGGPGLVISNKKPQNMLAGEHHPPHDVFIGQERLIPWMTLRTWEVPSTSKGKWRRRFRIAELEKHQQLSTN